MGQLVHREIVEINGDGGSMFGGPGAGGAGENGSSSSSEPEPFAARLVVNGNSGGWSRRWRSGVANWQRFRPLTPFSEVSI